MDPALLYRSSLRQPILPHNKRTQGYRQSWKSLQQIIKNAYFAFPAQSGPMLTALEGVTFTLEIPVSLGLLEFDTPVGHSQIQVQRLIPDL